MSIEPSAPPAPGQPLASVARERRGRAALRAPARGGRAALTAYNRGRRAALRAMRRRIDVPLYRNGYSLVASSALTSAIGLVFWLVAAHDYSTVAVGVGSALISVSSTIANLGHLNLKSGLNRFLPRAGRSTTRLVTRCYGIAVAVAGLASLLFIAGVGVWSPRLSFLSNRPVVGIAFVLATMAGTVFVLQDNVLTGIRKAHWVPLENFVYSILKLAALPALVLVMPDLGTFVSWTVTMPPLIIAVNWLLFRRLLPAHARATRDFEEGAATRVIARYVAADFSAYAIMTATMGLLPVVVLSIVGPRASAYYFISWSIAYGLYLIPSGMGMSMISEAATDPTGLAGYDRQTLVEVSKLLVPCVAVFVLGAPWMLALLGHNYAAGGTTLLRLLVLSALPWAVFVSYTNSARVQRRMHLVVRATIAVVALVVAIGVPLLEPLGVEGLGIGWLASQTIVASAIVVGQRVRRPRTRGGELLAGAPPRTRGTTRFVDGAVRALSSARSRWRHLRRPRIDHALRGTLAELAQPGEAWVVQSNIPALNDLAIDIVGPAGSRPAAIVKCTRGAAGARALRAHADALRALRDTAELADWHALIPHVMAGGTTGQREYLVESWLPGTTMERLLRDGAPPAGLLHAAASAIARLHGTTIRADRLDQALMAELVDRPLQRLRSVVTLRRAQTRMALVDRVDRELRALAGRELATSWVHGDLSPGNVLIGPGGTVTGLVDWERGNPRGLPQLDLLQLLISTRATVESKELGRVILELRRDPTWHSHERSVARVLTDCSVPTETLVLLAWLQHISGNLEKSARYARNPLFAHRNVDPVLECLTSEPAASEDADRLLGIVERRCVLLRNGASWQSQVFDGLYEGGRLDRGEALAPAAGPPLAAPAVPPGEWSLRTPSLSGVLARCPAWLADRATIAAGTVLCLATALWAVSLPDIDPRAMSNFGLLSVLPPTFVLALVVLSAGFVMLVHRSTPRPWLLIGYLLMLVLFIHGTPHIVYGTLRYSWTYKHVGIVDYILHHHGIDRTIAPLFQPVYHDWPGFFALVAVLARLAGLHSVLGLAGWGPVINNVMYLPALAFLFGGLTRDRRLVWLSCWLFYVADWVGQDYFSPQGFAFLLYLLLVGVVLRWRRPGSDDERLGRTAAVWLSVLLLAAIVVTHALTAVMACMALGALVAVGMRGARSLLAIALALTVGWDLTFAWPFTRLNLAATLATVHLPWETTSSNLSSHAALSSDQALVADVSRLVTVAVIGVAAAGAVRLLRARRLDRALAALTAAPVLLFAAGNYDGEMLFRIYLFAVPFLAFLGAHAFAGIPRRARTALTAAGVLIVLGLSLFPYYGDERANYITPQEVTAARWLDTHVATRSLVIDGTSCDVLDSEYYEHFTCLAIAVQPRDSWSKILANPVAVLSSWMSNPTYHGGYVFLSRSQSITLQETGGLPRGSLSAVRRKLLASPRFSVVYRNRDAIVLTLDDTAISGTATALKAAG